MKLSDNLGSFILVFILTLILGYYLGLAISTTVNYKLQDLRFKFPRAKNNITIEIIKKPRRKFKIINVKKNNKKDDVKLINKQNINVDGEDVENFNNYIGKRGKRGKKGKKKEKKNKQKQKREHFRSKDNTTCQEPKPFNPVIVQRAKYYNLKEKDKDRDLINYAKNYKKYRKNEKNEGIGNLVAYNHEDIETSYYDYDLNINCKKNKKKFKDSIKIKPRKYINFEKAKNTEKTTNNWDHLPTRKKLCPGFKCQREYQNCTNNHEIVKKV